MRKPLQLQQGGAAAPVDADPRALDGKKPAEADGSVLARCTAELCHLEFDQEGEPDDDAYAEVHRATRDDAVMHCEPTVTVPHPGVYVMPNPTGEAADTERGAA